MSAAYGKCDLCGRFAGNKGIESYDDWQPDYWNGPRTTFRCPECEARREPAAGPIIAAEALRDAAPACNCEDDYAWLNDRADRIEKEAEHG